MSAVSTSRVTGWTRIRERFLVRVVAAALAVTACGYDLDDGRGEPLALVVHPEFVQGMYADVPTTVLVTVADDGGAPGVVGLSAEFSHGSASVDPSRLSAGEIAQVTVSADPVVDELEAILTITGSNDTHEVSTERQIFVMPGSDDREAIARDLLALFTERLARDRPELGISEETAFDGALVAPRLLVVSHYMFENDDYELGLSWHIMVAPDDWSELYIRPKNSLTPVTAFRLSSWSAALAGQGVEFTEDAPPAEIVR